MSVSATRAPLRKLAAEGDASRFHVAAKARGRLAARPIASDLRQTALDAVAFGVVICSPTGVILLSNVAARELGHRRSGVFVGAKGAVIAAASVEQTALLHTVIRRACAGHAGGLRVRGSDEASLSLLVKPEFPHSVGVKDHGNAVIAIQADESMGSSLIAPLRHVFGLSPAQAEICALLVCGRTFEEVAHSRGIAVSTARTHFETICVKVGAKNLRQMLRIVSTLPALRASF